MGKEYVVLWASVNVNLDPKDISFSDVMRLLVLLIDDRFGPEIESNPGLKQAFDTDEAWFVPKIEVFFPTKGSYAADTAFLQNNVISIELMAKYRKF